MPTPVQRTIAHCKKVGWLCSVSSWSSEFKDKKTGKMVRFRKDMHGYCDYEAIDKDGRVIHLQITTKTNIRARFLKILEDKTCRPRAERIVRGGVNKVAIVGWDGQHATWRYLTPDDFDDSEEPPF